VPEALAAALSQRFRDVTCVSELDGVRVQVTVEGVAYSGRVEQVPLGRVTVKTPSTDGFELALAWTDRAVGRPGASFDDSCLVETNDVALARMWLDQRAQNALLASRYTAGARDSLRETIPMVRDGAWSFELRDDKATALRTGPEPSTERIADMLSACITLASRPARWAQWFAPLATALGGHAVARVEIGGRPVLRVRRDGAEVTVRLLRRLGPGDPGRLRTVVSAHRTGSGGETLALISDDLPRAAWPPLDQIAPSALAIDIRARALLDAARPSATLVRRHDIEVSFDGPFADLERLGSAIQLAAYWASDRGQIGPYR